MLSVKQEPPRCRGISISEAMITRLRSDTVIRRSRTRETASVENRWQKKGNGNIMIRERLELPIVLT